MRSYDEYREILSLWEMGTPKKTIAHVTGIPRGTVTDCIRRFNNLEHLEKYIVEEGVTSIFDILDQLSQQTNPLLQENYAYLLAMYLGDGYIGRVRSVYKLRIMLDTRYPNLINECAQSMQVVFADNKVSLLYRKDKNCVEVSCHHKHLPVLFPQHGLGKKHDREIKLEDWQQRIVDTYPLQFWKGLYHTDGSRFRNIVNGTDYPRYQFSNVSEDIIQLFCNTCDRLNVHWTTKTVPATEQRHARIDVFVSKRKDVEFLDCMIGAKS